MRVFIIKPGKSGKRKNVKRESRIENAKCGGYKSMEFYLHAICATLAQNAENAESENLFACAHKYFMDSIRFWRSTRRLFKPLTHSLSLFFSFSVFLQIFAANTADNKLVSRQRCHHRRRLVALQSIHLQRGAGEAQCALFRPVPLRGVRRCARVQADR